MLHMDKDSLSQNIRLAEELSWLEREHPDKEALASVARGHLLTLRMAASYDGFSMGPCEKKVHYGDPLSYWPEAKPIFNKPPFTPTAEPLEARA